jgi:hypothetical protein
MKIFLACVFLSSILLLPASCNSRISSTPITWQKNFGGNGSDYGDSVQQTADGGYIIAGMTDSWGKGNGDVYLLKIDREGNEQWSRTFGGEGTDWANSVRQTTDGGYIIAGATESFGSGEFDIYLIKTDKSGHETWSKTFGGDTDDEASTVHQTDDGGYIILGVTSAFIEGWKKDGAKRINPDIYLLKTDDRGNELWSKTFGGQYNDAAGSIELTPDGGYIIVGTIGTIRGVSYNEDAYLIPPHNDVYLIKTDAEGNEIWSKQYGGDNRDDGYDVWPTADGGYIIAGITETAPYGTGRYDNYVIKTYSDGNELWSKTFGDEDTEYCAAIRQTNDGGYIILGTMGIKMGEDSSEIGADIFLMRMDASGNELWLKTYGGSRREDGNDIDMTNDGGYIIAGTTFSFPSKSSDVYIIKTDAEGNTSPWGE